jgi:hypothetical protein
MTKKKTSKKASKKLTTKAYPYVVVRTYSAGVHVGRLVSQDGPVVVLRDASRLWRWRGCNSLHEVALSGVDTGYSRISEKVARITLTGAIEILLATDEAARNLSVPRWGT